MSFRIVLVALLACLAAVARGQDKPDADRDSTAPDAPAKSSDADKPEADDDDDDGGASPAPAKEKPKPAGKSDRGAKAPRSAAADEAAVRDALKTLARSLQEGKADGIKQVLYAANPTERKMVDAMAAMAVQIAGLYKASAKAFGEDEARSLTGNLAAEISRIDDAEVSTNGDTATVRYRDPATPPPAEGDPRDPATAAPAPPPSGDAPPAEPAEDAAPAMVLKRVDGRWRVPMSELSRDASPEDIEQRLADLDVQTRVIGDVAKDVAAGKYRTADKAAEAWQTKMMQAVMPGKPPAAAGERRKAEGEKGSGREPKKGSRGEGTNGRSNTRDKSEGDQSNATAAEPEEGETDVPKKDGEPEPAPPSDANPRED